MLSIGEKLGQPSYAVPYLAPNASGEAILNGVNYASGGGGVLNATGSVFVSVFVFMHALSNVNYVSSLFGWQKKFTSKLFFIL